MPKEMLITLWITEYSEKNPIKKLKFKNSFNLLIIRRLYQLFYKFFKCSKKRFRTSKTEEIKNNINEFSSHIVLILKQAIYKYLRINT